MASFFKINWLILLFLITFSLNTHAIADSSILGSVVCYNGWSQSGSTTSVDLSGKNGDGQNIIPPLNSGSGSNGHYLEDNELVIFEKQGPGVISRIWATNVILLDGSTAGADGVAGLQGANEMGVFKIFVDESTSPISVNSWDLFCSPSSSQITTNFVWPKRSSCTTPFDAEFTGDASNGAAGGWFNYFPIYFNSKIKIRVTGKELTRYYSIDYKLLSPNQASSSFSLASREPILKQAFVSSPSFSYSNEKNLTGTLSIPAGSLTAPTTGVLANLPNAGTITRVELTFTNPTISQINYDSFNLVSLTGFWDGSSTPAFITPIAHFFNYFNNSSNSQGLFSGFNGTAFYSNYPMPFKTGGKIQLENYGSQNVTVNYVVKYVETENAFNCQSVGRFKVEEKAFYPTTTGQDLLLLEKNNQKGKIVGLTLYAETISSSNESPTWGILEGDERVQIDSSLHANVHGTGTEDFFNGGWYFTWNPTLNCTNNSRSFSRPFAGNVISKDFSESTCRFRTLLYRQLLLDSYQYNDSIKFSIEHGGENEINGNYRTSVFYYDQGPSSLVSTDELDTGDSTSRSAHNWSTSNNAPATIALNSTFLSAGYPSFNESGYQLNASQFVEFSLSINPTNKGVVLKRVYDWLRGRQSADVYVDNVLVSKWIDPAYVEIPSANPLKKAAESTFFIPESFTNGKSTIRVKLQTNSSEKLTLFTISGRTVNYTIETPSPSCQPLYDNHNDPTDSSRFNIVISPVGFSTNAVAIDRAKILIDLDDTSQSFYGYSGFSQVFPISNHLDKLNFWIIPNQTFQSFTNNPGWCIDKQIFEDSCGFLESSGIENYNFILYERLNGRNVPDAGLTPQAMCQFGSWGRNGAILDFPENYNTPYYNDGSFNNRKTILSADVHEMSHSIFLLLDEYVNRPANMSPQTDPDFDTFSTAVKGSTDLTFNDLKQFYFHRPEEPTATRNDCTENALWKNYLGDGCGVPGVIDCVQNITQLENDPLPLPACVGGGTDCWYEIVCARGTRWDTGSYRPVINSLMNYHSGHNLIRFGYWDELLVNHVLQKGATGITLNYNMFNDFIPPVENCSDGIDNDLDRLIDCGDNQCSTNSACIAPVESCTVNANPTTLMGSGSSTITVTPINFASNPSSILVTCSDSSPAQNVPITTEGDYITNCSYTASTEIQTKNVQATVGSKTCQATVTVNPSIIPVVEICTNGLDDDSDLAIDCADSDCDGEAICAASTSVGACPLPNGNNSISRSNSTGIDTVSVDVGSVLVNPSVSLFTSLNELIPCSPTGSTRTCVIGNDFTRERSFKVSVTCSQTDGTRGRTDYFVTLNPVDPASTIPVPDIPFEFVLVIMVSVVILFSIKKK